VESARGLDDATVNLLLGAWVFALVILMSAAVIRVFLLPPEDAD
jgi:hypothetical protein